jgi:hypothetical protein
MKMKADGGGGALITKTCTWFMHAPLPSLLSAAAANELENVR